MARNYTLDTQDILAKYCLRVMKEHERFRILARLRFLFVWRIGEPEFDNRDGGIVLACVRKLPSRERDLYEKDIEFRVNHEAWQGMSERQRYRLVFHNLLHIEIELGEDFAVVKDDDGRVRVHIANPDIVIRTFREELKVFGVPPEYTAHIEALGVHRHDSEA